MESRVRISIPLQCFEASATAVSKKLPHSFKKSDKMPKMDNSLRRDVVRKTLVRSLKRYFAEQFQTRHPEFKKLSLKQKKRKVSELVSSFISEIFANSGGIDLK